MPFPPRPASGQSRNQVEHECDDGVDRDELDALVPVGLAVAADQRADEHGDKERADLGPVERQLQRLRRDKVAGEHQQRSEEHTSELQSRQYLVCRLLLEKKKNNILRVGLVDKDKHGTYDREDESER